MTNQTLMYYCLRAHMSITREFIMKKVRVFVNLTMVEETLTLQ